MRMMLRLTTLLLPLPSLLLSQNWEFGVDGGYGSFRRVPVTVGTATGTTRFAPGIAERRGENSMAVPKRKTSPSRRGMRRSADALARPTYVEDKDSGELRRPHHIDLKTGMYRGRQVLKSKKEA